MTSPFITVVVPVRNEELFLADTLRSLVEQHYDSDRFEVIVVDGQSTDNTVPVVRQVQDDWPQIQLLYNPKRLSSAARNLGVQSARGEFIVVIDGHCEIRSEQYLKCLADTFAKTGADCLGRPQPLNVSQASPLQRAIAVARASRLGHNPGSFIYADEGAMVPPQSVGVAYRKSVFAAVGLFDEAFDACEDVEFNHRVHEAGLTCWFEPRLAVHYHPRGTLSGLTWQMQRYGRGRAKLLMKHPSTLSPGPLIPPAFFVGLATALLGGLLSPLFASLFCGAMLLYGLAVGLASFWLGLTKADGELVPLFPPVFFAIHVGAAWGVGAELAKQLLARIARRLGPLMRV